MKNSKGLWKVIKRSRSPNNLILKIYNNLYN